MTDPDSPRARPVGISHVAVEVGDVADALDFYGSLFEFDLRGRTASGAFIDMGDQFLALSEVDYPAAADRHRHFGLVVDDVDAVERRLEAAAVEPIPGQSPDFRDPWGNYVQVVAYEDVQFTKADHVLEGMGLSDLEKSESAVAELEEKGMGSE